MENNNNINNNNENSNNDIPEWYETLDYDLNLPDQTPFKYTQIDIQKKYSIDTSTVDIVIAIFTVIVLLSMVFFYMKSNGYSLGNLFKNFKKHMYLSGKGHVKIRPTSTKLMVVQSR